MAYLVVDERDDGGAVGQGAAVELGVGNPLAAALTTSRRY
jgi:hypothetical protein